MCEDIYGKIVVLLLIMPLSVTSVLAIWYGIEILSHKICQSVNNECQTKKTRKLRNKRS